MTPLPSARGGWDDAEGSTTDYPDGTDERQRGKGARGESDCDGLFPIRVIWVIYGEIIPHSQDTCSAVRAVTAR